LFICFILDKNRKKTPIKRKLIFVFRLFVSFSLGKKKNKKIKGKSIFILRLFALV